MPGRDGVLVDSQADHLALLRTALTAYQPSAVPANGDFVLAAVLVPVYRRDGVPRLLLTRRSELVEHHKGQISFPGGMADPGDDFPVGTALREAWEEVGIRPEHVEVLGRLDDILTTSRFRVTPVVGVISHRSPYPFAPHPDEVAELVEVPIAHLLDPRNHQEERLTWQGQPWMNYRYQFGGHTIWGATGRILHQFVGLFPAAVP